MPTVKLELKSQPESLALVRGMLVGVGDLLGFDPELLHNLKTVVSEACNNVVLHAYGGQPGPLAVALEIAADAVTANVRDWGCGIQQGASSEDRIHVGLAVISAIADRSQFVRAPDGGGGTEVRMAFTDRGAGIRALERLSSGSQGAGAAMHLSGDAVATVSPAGLLPGVLARIAAAVAARAHFSVDRFCDVYLVTDAIAAHAEVSAVSDRLHFAIAAHDRRLELTVGPFRAGSGLEPLGDGAPGRLGSALSLLAVDLAVESVGGEELWRFVVLDGDGASRAPAAA